MLNILSARRLRPLRFGYEVRIGSAPVGQSSLTRRLSCIGTAGVGLILLAGQSPWRAGVVSCHSLEPGLRPGTVFVYQPGRAEQPPLHAGDVVLLRREGETWIKRVYATAGTRFWVLREEDGARSYCRPIRDGQQARFGRIARLQRAQGRHCEVARMEVPAGQVFVMGDAPCSRDSRELGPVLESDVVGRVVTALPAGLALAPESVVLSFPSRSTFIRYGTAVPPNVLKRDSQRRRSPGTRAPAIGAV